MTYDSFTPKTATTGGNSLPFVSVVVPVCNDERYVEPCLAALLSQTYPHERFEILVVDNRSHDGSAARIRAHAVRYLQENGIQSAYAARNRGIGVSRGDILAFTDVDCVAGPDWLSLGVGPFADATVGSVGGAIGSAAPHTWVQRHLARQHFLSQHATFTRYILPYAQTANVFYRRAVFEEVGCFEPRWKSGADADLAWRMQLLTSFKLVRSPAIVFHRHRSTLWSMLRQRFHHGMGSAALQAKYGEQATYRRGELVGSHTATPVKSIDTFLRLLARTAYQCGCVLGSSPIGLGRAGQDEYPCPPASPPSSARSTAPSPCGER
ncbi:MAG TPA: glycosyltransferase [Candidatus Acidoferrales bacterium]|nr:glycosyltransferase [Candidatus Acidoferrales bacterium]